MHHKSFVHMSARYAHLHAFLLLTASLFHLIYVFTKNKFTSKIIKNFMTTTV